MPQDRHGRTSAPTPSSVAKAAEIVGLYLAPPENAIVLAATIAWRTASHSGSGAATNRKRTRMSLGESRRYARIPAG